MLEQIVPRQHKRESQKRKRRHRRERKNGCKVLRAAAGTDLEQGGVLHDNDSDNAQESSSTTHHQQMREQQHQGIQLQEALVNLCWVIALEWYRLGTDVIWTPHVGGRGCALHPRPSAADTFIPAE